MESIEYISPAGERILFYSSPFRLETVEGLGDVEAEIQTQDSPYQDGSYYVDALLKPRDISLVFKVEGKDYDEIKARRSELGRVTNPKQGPGILRYTSGEVVREIEAVAKSAPYFPTGRSNRGESWQKASLVFVCHDPYWKSPGQSTRTLTPFTALFKLPMRLPMIMGTAGDATEAENVGHVSAPVLINVKGPVRNPQIQNETTGETLRINVTLTEEETLVIDTDPRRKRAAVMRGEVRVRNAFGLIDRSAEKSVLWQLAPGVNRLSYLADKGTELATVTVEWKDRFITV